MKGKDMLVEIYSCRNAIEKLEKMKEDADVGIENNKFVLEAFETKYKEDYGDIPEEEKSKPTSQ